MDNKLHVLLQFINEQYSLHIETSQLICYLYPLAGFFMRRALVLELTRENAMQSVCIHSVIETEKLFTHLIQKQH